MLYMVIKAYSKIKHIVVFYTQYRIGTTISVKSENKVLFISKTD